MMKRFRKLFVLILLSLCTVLTGSLFASSLYDASEVQATARHKVAAQKARVNEAVRADHAATETETELHAAAASEERARHEAPSPGQVEAHGAAGGHGGEHAITGEVAPVAKFITKDLPGVGGKVYLPFWVILIPILAGIGCAIFRDDSKKHFLIRNVLTVGACVLTLLVLVAMWFPVVQGVTVGGVLYRGLLYEAKGFMPFFPFTFRVDAFGLCIAFVSALLWLGSFINSITYMTHEKRPWRYDMLTIFALTAQLGVLLAGDFMTLFFFFEGLIIFPYGMVAHKEDAPALHGANTYLYMGSFTGFFLLAGSMLLYAYTGTIEIVAMGETINQMMTPFAKHAVFLCFILGFGGKAGLFLEHAWLPKAHPVAPAPGSTLLSGAMIKAGAYGIIRVSCMLYGPVDALTPVPWATMRGLGYFLIWVGVISMFLAVLSALITSNAKKMLAFHSVSQMGYIIMGVGCAAYLGRDGAMGMAGATYHMVNHAIFKAALFICVGTIYYRTHELDMYKLGGLMSKMPLTCIGLFIAACGIAGVPMFNGFASKTLLHHAILEAYEHSAHYTANGLPDWKLRAGEMIFMLTAGGTFASNMKLFALTAFGKRPAKYDDVKEAPWPMLISIILFSSCIIFIGLYPNWMLENFIGPALAYFKYDPASHPYQIIYNIHSLDTIKSTIAILWNPVNRHVFSDPAVLHNLIGGSTAVLLGGMYFVPGMRFHMFHIEVPETYTCFYWYQKGFYQFRAFCTGPVDKLGDLVSGVALYSCKEALYQFKAFCTGPVDKLGDLVYRAVERLTVILWMPMSESGSVYAKLDNKVTDWWGGDVVIDGILAQKYLKKCDQASIGDLVGVDGAVNGVAWGVRSYAQLIKRLQTGYTQNYALAMVLGIVLITLIALYN